MQPAQNHQHDLNELQASLDAYLDKNLEFAELRTLWIATLAEQPEMRNDAVRLIYQQPSNRSLSEERALALKRIIESAIHDGDNDWTVDLEEDGAASPATREHRAEPIEIKSSQVTAVPPKVRPGSTIGPGHILMDRFVLEEPLGGGGIGIVFRAHDRLRGKSDQHSGEIAIKVLREDYRTKPELLSTLQGEAVTAQNLSHPNIVRVHDYHQDGDTFFLTMELLHGEPLRRVLSRLQPAAMPFDQAMHIIEGMCRGLAHAHANGLIHADFKPGNVFLTKENEPKILDFGSAQTAVPVTQESDRSLNPSGEKMRAVTPAYSSCNRLEGGAPGFSDDVYSLSCVIYELLSGRHPYDRKSSLVVRELNLQPDKIKRLTDLQWRTLASGLMPSREDRATEIHDLQEVFSTHLPTTPLAPPVVRKRGYLGIFSAVLAGFLLGAAASYTVTNFDIPFISSKLFPPKTAAVAVIQETVDNLSIEEGSIEEGSIEEGSNEQASTEQEAIAEGAPDTEINLVPEIVDAFDTEVAKTSTEDVDVALPTALAAAIPPGFLMRSSEYQVHENAVALAIQIDRQGDVSGPANVQWTTFAGSAEPQLDYVSFFRKVVHFGAGETTKTVLVPIVSDSHAEVDEQFRIELSQPDDNMVLVQPYSASITIIDDDF